MRAASLWLAAVLILIWLVTLSWLAVVLYGELKRMDVSVKSGKFQKLEFYEIEFAILMDC